MLRNISFRSLCAMLLALALLCTIWIPLPARAVDPDEGLLMYYTFDDGTIADSSGNGRDGSGYGTLRQVPGVSGNAMYFCGGYAQLPDLDFTGMTEFTVSAWVAPLSTKNYERITSFGSNDSNTLDLLAPYTDSKYDAGFVVNGTTNHATAPTAYTLGVWKHLVMTFTDSGNLLTLYIDGQPVATKTVSGGTLARLGVTTNNMLGRSQFLGNPEYYGYMDEVRVYSRALDAFEILDLTMTGRESLSQSVLSSFSLAEENGLSNLDAVMQDLTLPASSDAVASDAVLTYSSENTDVLGNDGKIGNVAEPTTVNLTITATREGTTASVNVPVTVVPKGQRVADPVEVITTLGTAPELPGRISANDGSASVTVTWNTPETSVYAAMYALAGSFTVEGVTEEKETVTAMVTVDNTIYGNRLIQAASPDPYITYRDGWYYYVKSNGGICVAKARRLQDLGAAPLINVFASGTDGLTAFWAPELHYVDGCWYVYAAPSIAGTGRRMVALKATVPDDPQSPFAFVAEMGPTVYNEETETWELNADPSQNINALDGTVLEVGEKRYFIYSANVGSDPRYNPNNIDQSSQRLFICEMADATTLMGDRILLPAGGAAFEHRQNDIGNSICEGPQVFQKDGKVFLIYSTDQSNHDWYQECLLYADADSDLLDPASWTKYPGPLLTKSDELSDQALAPGHGTVVESPDGSEFWLVYHAYYRGNRDSFTGDQEGRYTRILKVEWDENGLPIFGDPGHLGDLVEQASGTADQVALKFEAESAQQTGNTSLVTAPRASGQIVVDGISGSASVTFTFNLPQSGRWLVSLVGCSSNGNSNSQNLVSINGTQYTFMYRTSHNGAYRFIPACLADAEQLGAGLYVELEAGENTITVMDDAASSGTVAVDYLYMLLDADPEYTVSIESEGEEGVTLEAGETCQLTAAVTPNDRTDATLVTWSSSDPTVADVDADGKVTALAAGETVITATLPGGAQATVTVSVPAPAETVYLGDLNRDNQLSVSDVVLLRKAILADEIAAFEQRVGDLNQDGNLSVTDVVLLRKAILNGDPLVEITL